MGEFGRRFWGNGVIWFLVIREEIVYNFSCVSIERRRKNVEVTISKELIPYLYTIQAVETVQDKVTLSVAIELFVSGTITPGKGCRTCRKSIGFD